MKLMVSFVIALGFCFISFLGINSQEVSQQTAHPKSSQPRLSHLVKKGSEVPDKGGRFQEFGDVYWLEQGGLVFWASVSRPNKKNEEWGLFSFKDGQTRTLLMEGENSLPTEISATKESKPEKIHLRKADRQRWGTWDLKTPIHKSRQLLYFSFFNEKYVGDNFGSVYTWDGVRLRKVLGWKDLLEVRGSRYEINSARVLNISPEGEALIYFEIKGGQNGLGLYDGTQLTPLLMSGDALPELQGVLVRKVVVRPRIVGAPCALPLYNFCTPITAWVFPNVIWAALEVTGAPYKKAIFRLTKEKAEMILAEFKSDPLDPKESMGSFLAMDAANPNSVIIRASKFSGEVLLHYRDGQFYKVFDKSLSGVVKFPHFRWKDPQGWRDYSVENGFFLRSDKSQYVFPVTFSRPGGTQVSVSSGAVETTYWAENLSSLFLFDGEHLINLSETTQMPWGFSVRKINGNFIGLLISEPEYVMSRNALLKVPTPKKWFLDANSEELRLQQVPELLTDGDKRITLADVVVWKSPGEAIARLDDGLYLFTGK